MRIISRVPIAGNRIIMLLATTYLLLFSALTTLMFRVMKLVFPRHGVYSRRIVDAWSPRPSLWFTDVNRRSTRSIILNATRPPQ